jgi:hypothetical protein
VIPGLFAAWLAASPTNAQTTGSVTGRVTDSSGGVLPGVTVEATSASLQGARTSKTGAYGDYRLSALPPGAYVVRASLPGFRKAQALATVGLDATATVNLVLQPSAQEDVVVRGDVPFVDTSSTMSSTSYTSRVISHLPCDRDFAAIVSANPSVNVDNGANQLRSQALAIKGATSAENQWIVDGVNATDVQRGIQGKAINNEFVQEVEVKSGGYQAEYGRALGGIVNVVTKSGGNQFHGDAFFYYDGSTMQAEQVLTSEDSVLDTMRIADYERRDFGADLGGYLLRDRLWFFAAYDRVDFTSEISRVVSTPEVSSDDRFPLDGVTNLYSGKLTWNVSPSTSAVASVFGDPTTNEGAGAADPRLGHGGIAPDPISNPDPTTWYSNRYVGGTDYGLRATQLFGSSSMLSFQGGRHQDRFALTAPDGIRRADYTCEGGTLGDPCAPPLVPNFETGGYGFVFGPRDSMRSHRDQYRIDGTIYRGNHTLKGGADYQTATSEATSFFTGKQLVRTFNEEGTLYYRHRFIAASAEDLTPIAMGASEANVRDVGLYLQDSWRPGPGWTINAGLRWDEERLGASQLASFIETSRWQPRLGVAWDPWQDGKTRVFAFAGRFSLGLVTNLPMRVLSGFLTATTFNFDPLDVTPDPGAPDATRLDGFWPAEAVDEGLKGIYQDEFSLGIERQLDPTFSVGLTATYRRLGNSIEDRCDLDGGQEQTNYNTCAMINPGSDGPIARGDVPWCNGLDGDAYECFDSGPAIPAAKRVYRGIELLVRKSFGVTLWLQASYVYSSLRGNYDGAVSQNPGQTDPGINADFDYAQMSRNAYGRLFLDRPSRFRFDGYYIAPFGLTTGLQVFAASGVPLDKIGFFNSFYQVRLVPRGYAGRLPTTWDANLTLSYPIRVGPATVTLQGYVFNLFNNQIPVWKNTIWSSSAPAGYPDTLFDPNQEQTNPDYGKIVSRQDPRLFRATIRVSF